MRTQGQGTWCEPETDIPQTPDWPGLWSWSSQSSKLWELYFCIPSIGHFVLAAKMTKANDKTCNLNWIRWELRKRWGEVSVDTRQCQYNGLLVQIYFKIHLHILYNQYFVECILWKHSYRWTEETLMNTDTY